MNPDAEQQPTTMNDSDVSASPTALQQAIRSRAMDTIALQQAQPAESLSRRVLILALTLLAMLLFVVMINFVVTGMHKIMDIWYPGSISSRQGDNKVSEPPPLGPDQPFYISVDPPLNEPSDSGATTSSAGAAKTTPP